MKIKTWLGVMIVILVATAMLIITVIGANATLDCQYINGSCSAGYLEVLRASDNDNAHAQTPSTGTYDYRICCRSDMMGLTNNCTIGKYNQTILRLSAADNAHIQDASVNTYTQPICLANHNVTCAWQNSNTCSAGTECLFSASALDNAHISNCGLNYNYSYCCAEPSCIVPYDDLRVANNTVVNLCSGTYNINDTLLNALYNTSVIISENVTNVTINCNNTKIVNNGSFSFSYDPTGMLFLNSYNVTVNNCYFANYQIGYMIDGGHGITLNNCIANNSKRNGFGDDYRCCDLQPSYNVSYITTLDNFSCYMNLDVPYSVSNNKVNFVEGIRKIRTNGIIIKNSRFENLFQNYNATWAKSQSTYVGIKVDGNFPYTMTTGYNFLNITNTSFINFYRALQVSENRNYSYEINIYTDSFYNNTYNIYSRNNLTNASDIYYIDRNYYDDVCDRYILDENGDGYGDAGTQYPYSMAHSGRFYENGSNVLYDLRPVWNCVKGSAGGGGNTFIDTSTGVRPVECTNFWIKLWHSFLYIFGIRKSCYVKEWAMMILTGMMMVGVLVFLRKRNKKKASYVD